MEVSIQETYTNGAKIKVPVKDALIDIEKPYLMNIQKNGTLKSAGAGQDTDYGNLRRLVQIDNGIVQPAQQFEICETS